jgi:D-alanyl-lipoteichoic acid acyltransferase DltB (MBOAT superfamily)
MLFNSIPYIFFFLPSAAIILFVIPKNYQWLWLLICSTFFYYKLLPVYLLVFFTLIIINYYFGLSIEKAGERKRKVCIIALITNLAILAFFKYSGVFETILTKVLNISKTDTILKIILPVGLSYFVFTILSYLIELKRGTIKAEKHIGIFASSLMFFPKILQGPIERPGNIFLQFKEDKSFDYNRVVEGLKLILWGLFKKLVVADRLAIYVNAVYGNAGQHNGTTLAVATVFYAFQIYADFSGYTDIALGSAKVLGFNLTNNFNRPYFATSVREFWNRWHISFSIWLRDYLFLPLAYYFSRIMKNQKYFGIASEKWIFMFSAIITFSICGIWHGEGFNYLTWGLLFGIYLSYSNWTSKTSKNLRKKLNVNKQSDYYTIYKILVTFLLVSFSFIFFRAGNLKESLIIINKIFTEQGNIYFGELQQFLYCIIGILLLVIIEIKQELSTKINLPYINNSWIKEQLAYVMLIILIMMIGVFDISQFIYFQY